MGNALGPAAPQTWAEVEAAAQKLQSTDMSGYVVRANPPNRESRAFLASHGGRVIKLDE